MNKLYKIGEYEVNPEKAAKIVGEYYRECCKELELYDIGVITCSIEKLEHMRRIKRTVEFLASFLEDDEALIIKNEVLLNKKKNWYYNYMSNATYYRHRTIAYNRFVEYLMK